MPKNNKGRSTTGEPSVPYYRSTPDKEAAKHLRLVVGRYLRDCAAFHEVAEAWQMFTQEVNRDKI